MASENVPELTKIFVNTDQGSLGVPADGPLSSFKVDDRRS